MDGWKRPVGPLPTDSTVRRGSCPSNQTTGPTSDVCGDQVSAQPEDHRTSISLVGPAAERGEDSKTTFEGSQPPNSCASRTGSIDFFKM